MRADLRFEFNGLRYSVVHTLWVHDLNSCIPTEDQRRIVERDLVQQVASMIVDKCNIKWGNG